MKKFIVFIMLAGMLSYMSVGAVNNFENNPGIHMMSETGVDKEVDDLVKSFESILDPNNNELEQKMNATLEKHKDNPIVKFFNKIASWLTSFLDALFNLATEATEVTGV